MNPKFWPLKAFANVLDLIQHSEATGHEEYDWPHLYCFHCKRQVIGEQNKPGDLVVNPCVAKQLNNMRAAGKDDNTALATPIKFSLEEAMEYIGPDEFVEVTPESIRLRKILLNEHDRKRSQK